MKQIIGAIESVNLPELELFELDAKVDTGAENCAIHGDIIEIKDGMVTFELHDEVHEAYNGKIITLPISRQSDVKSSNGESENRIFIETTIKLFGKTWKTEMSLADRSKMKYPMLLGKNFLTGKFLVDIDQEYVWGNKK